MKKTLIWGALLSIMCAQGQAQTLPETPTHSTTTTTVTTTPSTPAEVPSMKPTMPAEVQAATPPVINCDYKLDARATTVDQALVVAWSEKATVQAFEFDPTNIDTQMQKLQNCFTEQGWTGFNTALQKSGNLDAIKTQQLTVSSQLDGKAQVEEVKDNQWKIDLPLQVVYQNSKEKVTQLLNIKLVVGRKTTGDLGITQMVATPRAAAAAPQTTTTTATVVTTPNDATSAPVTTTPDGTPATPVVTPPTTNSSAPTVGDPTAKPNNSSQPIDQEPAPVTTTP